jgi:hypothetical protein
MPLSDVTIRNLKPREKPYKVSDFDGLFVLVKPTGSRLRQFKHRLHGKERLLSIGPYPEVGLAKARAARDAARALVAAGLDPSTVKAPISPRGASSTGPTLNAVNSIGSSGTGNTSRPVRTSVRRAEKRTRRARMMQVRGQRRPTSGALATFARRGTNYSSSGPIQTILPSGGMPYGQCRVWSLRTLILASPKTALFNPAFVLRLLDIKLNHGIFQFVFRSVYC